MAVVEVYRRFFAVQYDGTNGEEVAAALEASVVSDNGTELQVDILAEPIEVGKWVVCQAAVPGISGMDYWANLDDLAPGFAVA